MSLKAIEMQIALPRTLDAQKVQEQLQQRGQLQNAEATREIDKEARRRRSSVTRKNELEKTQADNGGRQPEDLQPACCESSREDAPAPHPFKGAFVDFSG
ncbi:hypothetical protein V1498_14210 [Peribacillus sp. SCS-26]|uniref:hypothetical protein n=1 Tax=Paraperibacillus marinus TaxID=3115295 RepID=UPI003905830A